MAIIKCPECGEDVSDETGYCPKCFYFFPNYQGISMITEQAGPKEEKQDEVEVVVLPKETAISTDVRPPGNQTVFAKRVIVSFLVILALGVVVAAIGVFSGLKSANTRTVERLISTIGVVDSEDGPLLAQIEDAYKALSQEEKDRVSGYDRFLGARAEYHALLVDEQISNLNVASKIDSKTLIAVEDAYESLTAEEKQLVKNYDKLVKSRDRLDDIMMEELANSYQLELIEMVLDIVSTNSDIKPQYELNRKERTYYCKISISQEAYTAIAFLPMLSSGIFNQIKYNYSGVCESIYSITKEYGVDTVLKLLDPSGSTILEIKNGDVAFSML